MLLKLLPYVGNEKRQSWPVTERKQKAKMRLLCNKDKYNKINIKNKDKYNTEC